MRDIFLIETAIRELTHQEMIIVMGGRKIVVSPSDNMGNKSIDTML